VAAAPTAVAPVVAAPQQPSLMAQVDNSLLLTINNSFGK
jgi:hypothetical protein